jgi:CubicO group peptidase (beta-lactamase class C family)
MKSSRRAAAVLVGCLVAALVAGAQGGSAPASAQPLLAIANPAASARPDPAALGFDARALHRLARSAKRKGSTCFAVARRGQVVGSWSWRGTTAETPQEVFSVTKSVTSTLVGMAQADQDLSIADPAATYIPAWRDSASASVTVRNLLANDSGRYWTPVSDYGDLVHAPDRTAYAVGLSQQYAPGSVWAYNNAAIQTLDAVLSNATGQDTAAFAKKRLFKPLGMAHTQLTHDASGNSTDVFFGMQSTCSDLLRFGQLYAQRGRWEGDRLVPTSWVKSAVGASSQSLNAAYGLLWWLNRHGPLRSPLDADNPGQPPGVATIGRLAPGAPANLFAALGFGGQVVLVDPRSQTVVVRLGQPGDAGSRDYTFADAARVVTEALRASR